MGGRSSKSGISETKDWLAKEGGHAGGKLDPMDLDQFKGWTVEQAEARERGLGHEEMFVFDENDNLIAAYKGGPAFCRLSC